MVKPPKTMQPEAVDLQKAGRATTQAFGEDSFRNYMARKIDMQRQQFGLVEPPPPPPSEELSEVPTPTSTNKAAAPKGSKKRVRFAPNVVSPPSKEERRRRRKRLKRLHHSQSKHSTEKKSKIKLNPLMQGVLSKLQERHGIGGSREKGKRKRKERMQKQQSQSQEFPTAATMVETFKEKDVLSKPKPIKVATTGMKPVSILKTSSSRASPPATETHTPSPSSVLIKKRKQSPRNSRPDLFFRGVVVLVNGYTNPDPQSLQRMLQRHGGDLELYETSRVTHIIAEHLSDAKARMYTRIRAGKPVVTPQWIVDCVQQQTRLAHAPYLLPEVTTQQAQTKNATLTHCWTAKAANATAASAQKGLPPTKTKTISSATKPTNAPIIHNIEKTNNPNPAISPENSRKAPSHSTSSHRSISSTTSRTDGKYINGKLRTTGTDPQFLASFFENSRLSFIGSYQQRASTSNSNSPRKRQRPTGSSRKKDDDQRWVLHVDMDCFFAAVVLRNFPQYQGHPVVISHHGETTATTDRSGGQGEGASSPSKKKHDASTSECATCNYEARKYGIKKGMYLGRAKQLCPNLVVLRYDFEGYEQVSEQVADILQAKCDERGMAMEQVSCDEAYLELITSPTNNNRDDLIKLAEGIRSEIFAVTQCTATVGVAANKLLAKLATDKVKPNGCHVVNQHPQKQRSCDAQEDIQDEPYRDLLQDLALRDLHGVGYRMERKLLADGGLRTVQDVWDLKDAGESELVRILGPGLGKKIHGFCHGRDPRPVQAARRQTIGAECNYGVRFDGPYGVDYMVQGLAQEVARRMEGVGVRGSSLTLKVKQRKPGAKPPPKFLGHGSCHNLSKGANLPNPTRDWQTLSKLGYALWTDLQLDPNEVRGMGLIVSKLAHDYEDDASNNPAGTSLKNWFQKPLANEPLELRRDQQTPTGDAVSPPHDMETDRDEEVVDSAVVEVTGDETPDLVEMEEDIEIELPSMSQLHMSQVDHLPSPMRASIHRRLEKRKQPEPLPPPKAHEPRRRQTDVKRMLRLAAVKAGQESLSQTLGSSVSIPGFETLPLEVQLQIANGDNDVLGSLSPSKRQKVSSGSSRRRTMRTTMPSEIIELNDDDADGEVLSDSRTESVESSQAPELREPEKRLTAREMFDENVMPLMVFMGDNAASEETAKHVKEFMALFITDHPLVDVTLVLRAIKNRKDSWASPGYFQPILKTVVDYVQDTQGTLLDVEYLGLSSS